MSYLPVAHRHISGTAYEYAAAVLPILHATVSLDAEPSFWRSHILTAKLIHSVQAACLS